MLQRTLPVMVLQGSPYQRGHQHGSTFEPDIVSALKLLERSVSGRVMRRARCRAAASWRILLDVAPAIAAEIEGLAAGSRCAAEDIFLRIGFEFFGEPAATGCSALAFNGGGGAIVGQNWDAPGGTKADLVLFMHSDPDGSRLATVASKGTLGWFGQNGRGLSLVTNDMMLDMTSAGLPSQVVRRLVMSQADVPSALRLLRRLPHMSGRSYLLGDASGRIAGVELSPATGVNALHAAGPLVHTNHAVLEQTQAVENRRLLRRIYPSTYRRYASLVGATGSLNSVTDAMRVLRDRTGAPNAISKSLSPLEATETACSVVYDCAAGVMHLCLGLPSAGAFVACRVAENASGHIRPRSDRISQAAPADTRQTWPKVRLQPLRTPTGARQGSRSRALRE